MKQVSTLFLKGVIFAIGIAVIALCIFVLPAGLSKEWALGYTPVIIGMYIAAIPFFIALYQALRLLSHIDKDNAFSESSITALKYIKYCAETISGLYAVGMPYIVIVADKDDAPGVAALGLVIVFASIVVAVFAAVLQKLLKHGMAIKSENDLTV
ncbi:DUF2975 domain-containing protein [Candidatus Parcubacteria bacterium]|nr:DUF2975 domain-containing protein [Candidatus Parcubacteria bacterium]